MAASISPVQVDHLNRVSNGLGDSVAAAVNDGYLTRQEWQAAQAGAEGDILRGVPVKDATQELTGGFMQPDYARALVYSGASEDLPVTVEGDDVNGGKTAETRTKDGPGEVAFAKIDKITITVIPPEPTPTPTPAATASSPGGPPVPERLKGGPPAKGGSGEVGGPVEREAPAGKEEEPRGKPKAAAGGQVSIGTTNRFGLAIPLYGETILLATEDGKKTDSPAIVPSEVEGAPSSLVEFTPNGTSTLRIYYIVETN